MGGSLDCKGRNAQAQPVVLPAAHGGSRRVVVWAVGSLQQRRWTGLVRPVVLVQIWGIAWPAERWRHGWVLTKVLLGGSSGMVCTSVDEGF